MEKDVFKSYIPIFIFLPNYKFFEIQRKVRMNSHLKPAEALTMTFSDDFKISQLKDLTSLLKYLFIW